MSAEKYRPYGFEMAPAEALGAANPSIDMVRTIVRFGGKAEDFDGWYATPSINPPQKWLSQKEILVDGAVDVYALLEPFLGNHLFDQTLRVMDVANGCGRHCGTCLADSQLPSKIVDFQSYLKLLSDDRYISMLQPDSFRFGSSGDILDHPFGPEIVKATIEATANLHEKRVKENPDQKHKISVFSNYLPKNEEKLDELIEIAINNPDRMRLCISLPFNKTDVINRKFVDYVLKRPDIFGNVHRYDQYGLIETGWGSTLVKNVNIQDVRHPYLLFRMGRNLAPEVNAGRVSHYDIVSEDRELAFSDKGLVKLYLNPDALWLMGYVTPVESHTNRVYTPVNSKNVYSISHLPYHPDFPTPPNWPGGSGVEKSIDVADKMKKQAKRYPYREMKTVR